MSYASYEGRRQQSVFALLCNMSSAYRMVAVEEAVSTALSHAAPLPAERTALSLAFGRVLAEDVVAQEAHPPFRASIKDGFAVAFADGAGDFPVAATSRAAASDGPPAPLARGTVAYVTTGAPLPDGADAVVQVENTETLPSANGEPRRVRILKPARAPGEDIRQLGSDVAPGEVRVWRVHCLLIAWTDTHARPPAGAAARG